MGEIILKQADFPGRFFFAKVLLFTVALSRMPIFDWGLRLKFHGRKRRIYSFDVKVFYCITLSLLFSCSRGSPLFFSRFLIISHFFHELFAFFKKFLTFSRETAHREKEWGTPCSCFALNKNKDSFSC